MIILIKNKEKLNLFPQHCLPKNSNVQRPHFHPFTWMFMGPKVDVSSCHGFGMMQYIVHFNQAPYNANWWKLTMSTHKGCTN